MPPPSRCSTPGASGKYDPRFNIDGLNKPVVIPPAYGLDGIHRITLTGDGDDIAYWNRYVAVTQMGGLGTMTEPRLNIDITNGTEDRVSSKLPALQAYQLSLAAPAAPAGSFDAAAAARGKTVFEGAGQCASCHSGALFTDANTRLHPPADSVVEPETPSYAARSATKMVPHVAAQGRVAARAVLPRWIGGHAGRRGDRLQHQARPRPDAGAAQRPDRIPEVVVIVEPCPHRATIARCARTKWRAAPAAA